MLKALPAASAPPALAAVRNTAYATPNKTVPRRAAAQARTADAEADGCDQDCAPALNGWPLRQQNLPRQQQDPEQDGSGSADTGAIARASVLQEQGLELDGLADAMLPLAGEHGIFELILGNGDSLGIVVNRMPDKTSLLLSPSSAALGGQLKRGRMELERGLAQRIGRDVLLTVL
ncbi:hypothetical protein LT85_0511 [Collimonas arenae]|uniref:Uncharacterized protein n=2 Tax=Collimonas arenae TaxID=279058 RepID=A0A0A1F553_9BURK|nr:hypothetical protein LT85_0511 [Collimonas arenae]